MQPGLEAIVETYESMVHETECAMMASFVVLKTLGITLHSPFFATATAGMHLPRQGNAVVANRVSKIKDIEDIRLKGLGLEDLVEGYVDPVREYKECIEKSIILPIVQKDMMCRANQRPPLDRMMENVPTIIAYAKIARPAIDDPAGTFSHQQRIRTPEYLKEAAPYYLRELAAKLEPEKSSELLSFKTLIRGNADAWESAAGAYIDLKDKIVNGVRL